MIRLHTAQTPNGRKISIALEELELAYDVRRVDLSGEQMKPEFLALNPNHKIPVLEDDGRVIWESGAILLHLGEQYDSEGRILPNDPNLRMQAIQYAFFQTGGDRPEHRAASAKRCGRKARRTQEMIEIFTVVSCHRLDRRARSHPVRRTPVSRRRPTRSATSCTTRGSRCRWTSRCRR